VRLVCSREKVSFPVAWHSAVLGLGRPLADGDGIDDLSQSPLHATSSPNEFRGNTGTAQHRRGQKIKKKLAIDPVEAGSGFSAKKGIGSLRIAACRRHNTGNDCIASSPVFGFFSYYGVLTH
jgi:hypothetical protein